MSAAVLCGGASRRMGRDKSQVELDGETLLRRALRQLRTVADPAIVASGGRPIEVPDGVVVVADATAGSGPLGGVVAALRASPHRLCAVVAVDMPGVRPALLRSLADACEDDDAVVPLSTRGPEPLHAVYARSILSVAEPMLGGADTSMRALLGRARVRFVDVAALAGAGVAAEFARNLNQPADVTEWLRRRRPAPGGTAAAT